MTWLNPWAGLWALLAIPVVALYILRIRRRREQVPTLQFWEEVVGESAPRAWWQRLRHLFSLLLQLVFLALLVFALMDPLTAGQSADRRLVVIVLDRSASMSMPASPTETRFDRAVAGALRVIDGIREWDEAVVITSGGEHRVESGRTGRRPVLRRAIRSVSPSADAGDLSEAVAFARRIDPGGRRRELVVLTDVGGLRDGGPPEEGERWIAPDPPVENVGITAFASRRSARDRSRHDVLVRVGNFGADGRSVSIPIRLDERIVDAPFVTVAPGMEQTLRIGVSAPDGGTLSARLGESGRDGLALDDVATRVLPPPRRIRVGLIAGRPNRFLEEALAAVPLVTVVRMAPDASPPAGANDCDVAVLDGIVPETLPELDTLILDPPGDGPFWTLGPPIENVLITGSDETSPLLEHTRWDRVRIRRARPIVSADGRSLLSSFGDSLLTRWDRPAGRVAVLSVDLSRSDLPLRTAFPILVANWLQGVSVGEGMEDAGGAPENLLSASESNGWAAESEVSASADVPMVAPGRAAWWWLALAGLALTTIEWGLHQRRVVE